MHPTVRDDSDLAALEGKESRNPSGSRQTSTPSFTNPIRSISRAIVAITTSSELTVRNTFVAPMLCTAVVVKSRGAAVGMASDTLGDLR
jgi:hypothetical protein